MSITKLLPIARSFGAENWVKLKPFIRAVSNKETIGQHAVRLKVNQLQINGLGAGKFLSILPESMREQLKVLYAEALKPGNKTSFDMIVNRFTPKSGVVSIKTAMKDASGKAVANYSGKVAVNSSGVKGHGGITYNPGRVRESFEFSYLNNARGPKATIRDFLGGISYNVKDGLFKLRLPKTKVGGVTVKANVSADEKFMNQATYISSEGRHTSTGKAVDEVIDNLRLLG